MIPQEVFKRRRNHNNTPIHILLIFANFIVVLLAATIFADKNGINWFFWIVLAVLGVYNYLTIRKNYEVFNKTIFIAYGISWVLLIITFFLFKG